MILVVSRDTTLAANERGLEPLVYIVQSCLPPMQLHGTGSGLCNTFLVPLPSPLKKGNALTTPVCGRKGAIRA